LETPWEDIKKGMILDVIHFTRALLSSLAYKTPPFVSTCLDKILFFPSRVSSASMLYLITKILVRQRNDIKPSWRWGFLIIAKDFFSFRWHAQMKRA
jgi:hypothetical protein